MNWENGLIWFVAFLISATVHEAAHAWVAMLGGDRTAYHGGQVTLNPLPHIRREPFGMVGLPLLSLYLSGGDWCFGYASAPVDPIWAYHNPKKASLMSAAGPLANVLLAAVAFAVLWFIARPGSGSEEAVRRIAGTFFVLNLLLAMFNLIPLPPLDGAGVVSGLSRPLRQLYDQLARVPYLTLVTFILANKLVPVLFTPVFRAVNSWLPYPFRW